MTELHLSKIAEERVGYELKSAGINHPRLLKKLTFENFIPQYSKGAHSPQEVYVNLKQNLDSLLEKSDHMAETEETDSLDNMTRAALQREAVMNAMQLIEENYLENKITLPKLTAEEILQKAQEHSESTGDSKTFVYLEELLILIDAGAKPREINKSHVRGDYLHTVEYKGYTFITTTLEKLDLN